MVAEHVTLEFFCPLVSDTVVGTQCDETVKGTPAAWTIVVSETEN